MAGVPVNTASNSRVSRFELRHAHRRQTYWRLPPAAAIMPLSRRIPSIFRRRSSLATRSSGKVIKAQTPSINLTPADAAPITTVATARLSSNLHESTSRVTLRLPRSHYQAINQIYARINASFHTRAPRHSRPSPLLFRYLLRNTVYNLSSSPSLLTWNTIIPHPLLCRALSLCTYASPSPLTPAAPCSSLVPSSAYRELTVVSCSLAGQTVINGDEDEGSTTVLCRASSAALSQQVLDLSYPERKSTLAISKNLTQLQPRHAVVKVLNE